MSNCPYKKTQNTTRNCNVAQREYFVSANFYWNFFQILLWTKMIWIKWDTAVPENRSIIFLIAKSSCMRQVGQSRYVITCHIFSWEFFWFCLLSSIAFQLWHNFKHYIPLWLVCPQEHTCILKLLDDETVMWLNFLRMNFR